MRLLEFERAAFPAEKPFVLCEMLKTLFSVAPDQLAFFLVARLSEQLVHPGDGLSRELDERAGLPFLSAKDPEHGHLSRAYAGYGPDGAHYVTHLELEVDYNCSALVGLKPFALTGCPKLFERC